MDKMIFKLLLTTFLAGLISLCHAQVGLEPESNVDYSVKSAQNKKQRAYRVWVDLGDSIVSGTLYQVTDTSVWIVKDQVIKYFYSETTNTYPLDEYLVRDIHQLKTRKVNRFGRVASITTLIVGVVGSLGYYINEYENQRSYGKALTAGIVFGGTHGLLTGVLIGLAKETYPINQNLETYHEYKYQLMNRCAER